VVDNDAFQQSREEVRHSVVFRSVLLLHQNAIEWKDWKSWKDLSVTRPKCLEESPHFSRLDRNLVKNSLKLYQTTVTNQTLPHIVIRYNHLGKTTL
jgi:hypothetical protein